MVSYGTVWYGMVRNAMVWCGTDSMNGMVYGVGWSLAAVEVVVAVFGSHE